MLKIHEKNISEQSEYSMHVNGDENFNSNIWLVEMQRELDRRKNNKVVVPDYISNKLMKSGTITEGFHTLFSFCFAQSILPSVWHKVCIALIPRSADKDPSVHLNYTGISLLSCVFNVYTGILDCRNSQYCENNGLINEEQYVFGRGGLVLNTHVYLPVQLKIGKCVVSALKWHLVISRMRSIGLAGICYCTSVEYSTKLRVNYVRRSNALTLNHVHVLIVS